MRSVIVLLLLTSVQGCYLAHRIAADGGADAGADAGAREDTGARPPGITAAVAAGFMHACSLTRDGNVFCWGDGRTRVLGPGSYLPTPTPIPVDLGGAQGSAIAAGAAHSCALSRGGEGLCWGQPYHETQLVLDASPFVDVAIGLSPCLVGTAGALVCGGPFRYEDEFNPIIRIPSGVSRVAAGERFVCVLSDERVICFGWNTAGQLGRPAIHDSTESEPGPVEGLPPVTGLSCGREHACALAVDGEVYCWGSNVRSQLGAPGSSTHVPVRVDGLPTDIVDIEAGHNNTCALRSTGELICWGDNDFGQLGRADREEALGPTDIDVPARIVSMSVGGSFICALDAGADVWCWGRNDFGQLGDGTLDYYRGRPALVRF